MCPNQRGVTGNPPYFPLFILLLPPEIHCFFTKENPNIQIQSNNPSIVNLCYKESKVTITATRKKEKKEKQSAFNSPIEPHQLLPYNVFQSKFPFISDHSFLLDFGYFVNCEICVILLCKKKLDTLVYCRKIGYFLFLFTTLFLSLLP